MAPTTIFGERRMKNVASNFAKDGEGEAENGILQNEKKAYFLWSSSFHDMGSKSAGGLEVDLLTAAQDSIPK